MTAGGSGRREALEALDRGVVEGRGGVVGVGGGGVERGLCSEAAGGVDADGGKAGSGP